MATVSAEEILIKNREMYTETTGPVWQLAVYGAVHDGWEFINLGGREVLDRSARRASLGPRKWALDLCAGQAAGCRYLAQTYGCNATAVEMNPGQIANARKRLAETDAAVASRVHLEEADVLEYRPTRAYDLVFSVDALMLIPDIPRLLAIARHAVDAGGRVELVTIGAGPSVDQATRAFAWDMDGMISLFNAREWTGLLERAGFEQVRAEDETPLAIAGSIKLDAALASNRETIERVEGREAYLGWRNVGAVYLAAFSAGKLSYLHLSAAPRASVV